MAAMRYCAAFVILVYGFAKINGSQFTILDSELDKPMGQVSGFWLTWYYFGYSPVYGTFIAAVQIGGALLLTFQRTALLGACILLPILANIVSINFCYGVELSATVTASFLLATTIAVIGRRWKELIAVFWPTRSEVGTSARATFASWTVRFAMVAAAFGFTYWVANYNNRLPTPLDGAWDVVAVSPASAAAQFPETVFFEYNRASMIVFKSARGTYDTHHFEIDRQQNRIWMWDRWLSKGPEIFNGVYTLASADLTLSGNFQNASNVSVQLRKRTSR